MSRPAPSPLADPTLRAALATGLDTPAAPRAARLATYLANAFGPTTVAVVHYGSHANRSDARAESAHDFLVIVDDYGAAYRSLAARVGTSYRPGLAAALNRVMAPNVVAVQDAGATPPLRAKVAVFSRSAFRRACSQQASDHFVRGRLFQPAQLPWSRDAECRQSVVEAVLDARAGSFQWGRSSLPPSFDAATYCRSLLRTSFASEIRPEDRDRVSALLDAQHTVIVPMYAALLDWLRRAGVLAGDGRAYTDPRPPGMWARFRSAAYFRRTKLRATLRWGKYVALYDDWLDYVVAKIARRSNVAIELTPRERRWPLIFLWPKAIRYLRGRPQRRA